MPPIQLVFLSPIKAEDRPVADPFRVLEREGAIRMRYLEFLFHSQLSMILKGLERSPLSRVFRNFLGVLGLFVTRDRVLLIGTEPFRIMTLALNFLKRRHRCVYHTSWPWSEITLDGPCGVPFGASLWRQFLKGTVSVSFTPDGAEGLGRYGARSFFIPHTVDCEVFLPAAEHPPAERVDVLFVGHLNKVKGVHVLIDVIRRGGWTNCLFSFLGKGPLEPDVRQLETEGHPVRYLGLIRDREKLAAVYREADMLVLPSVRIGLEEERFGMVLIEAMASGLPVIASDCLGPRQIVKHGETGILVPQNDAEALGDAIRQLAGSPERRRALGQNGRREAEQKYDKRKVARQWMEVIRLVAGEPDRAARGVAGKGGEA